MGCAARFQEETSLSWRRWAACRRLCRSTFSLPGEGRNIRCEGEVVNVPDKKGYGMGIRFVNISPADAHRIEAFARALLEGDRR